MTDFPPSGPGSEQTPSRDTSFVHRGQSFAVSQVHCVDQQEGDRPGELLYFYEYDVYVFARDGESLRARSYSDEPEEVSFLGMERDGEMLFLSKDLLSSDIVQAALEYLRVEKEKSVFKWLDPENEEDGYTPLHT